MKSLLSLTGRLALMLVLAALLLSGCSLTPTPTPQPTVDPATLVAQAVQTISAEMTQDAIRNPSPTPNPTETPVPTQTPVPPTPTPSLPTNTPTATATTQPAIGAKFLTAGTFPENKFEYVPNEKFGLAVRFKNIGAMQWTPGYRLVLVSHVGEITVQPEAELGRAIPPGEVAEFDLWAFGSESLGTHTWVFQLYTSSGAPVPGGVGSFTYKAY